MTNQNDPNSTASQDLLDPPQQTILRAVDWSDTPDGRSVPTAIFDPIELSGGTFKDTTLNNVAALEEADVWLGDTIMVTYDGEGLPAGIKRIGDHTETATPVIDPNGWPVGAGEIVAIEAPYKVLDGIEYSRVRARRGDDEWNIPINSKGVSGHNLPRAVEPLYPHVLKWARALSAQGYTLAYRREGQDLVRNDETL